MSIPYAIYLNGVPIETTTPLPTDRKALEAIAARWNEPGDRAYPNRSTAYRYLVLPK